MKKYLLLKAKPCRLFPFVILFVVLLGLNLPEHCHALYEATVPVNSFQYQTIDRSFDPVILEGRQLPGMRDKEISTLRLFAGRQGQCEPIAFQIDEKGPKGDYAYKSGKGAREDVDKGLLDSNDELAFMARDLGDRMSIDTCPTGGEAFHEIEITDPLKGGKGWAYLISYQTPPPLSPVDYISYDPDRNLLETAHYLIAMTNPAGGIMDYWSFQNKKEGPVDILDRFKIRIEASFFWGTLKIKRNESDLRMKVHAYTDGPIRVVREVKYTIKIILSMPSLPVKRQTASYLNFTIFPNDISIPFDLGRVLTNATVFAGFDFNKNFEGAGLSNEYNSGNIIIDGRMSALEKSMNHNFSSCYVIKRGKEAIMGRATLSQNMLDLDIKKSFFYLDDKSSPSPPEDNPGHFGTMAWLFENLKKFKGGEYNFIFTLFFSREFKKEDNKAVLNMQDCPLQSVVR